MKRPPTDSAGTSFVELMVAISIVGIALMVMLTQVSISFRENAVNENRAFAYRKAMALLAEIQNGVERGEISDALSLDRMADKAPNLTLTVIADRNGNPLAPDHLMSGNTRRLGEWLWSRRVDVEVPPQQARLRYVRVTVSRRRDGEGAAVWDPMAVIGSVVTLDAASGLSSKYYDVYVLALAEAPSEWLPMTQARTLLENARIELQTIDNGLKYRFHWITELGYGRDPVYTPFVNTASDAQAAAPWVYWYPGLLGSGDAADGLYAADLFSGRVRTEAEVLHDYDASDNPYPHAVADQWNHCLRLPEARALFEQRVASGQELADAPPLQILLEDMWADPDRYRNAIFVNLHGTALPLPPLRNYADAAREPAGHPGVRVVAHAERLWTERDESNWSSSERPAFRVYGYKTDPDVGPAVLSVPITVQIFGVDLTASVNGGAADTLQIERLRGGIDETSGLATGDPGDCDYHSFEKAPELAAATDPYEMSYEVGYDASGPEPFTWVRLHHTPLVAPAIDNEGLDTSERLYGLEYIPSPVVEELHAFEQDLESNGGSGTPKNTARWRLQLPATLLDPTFGGGLGGNVDHVVKVVTRIGTDLTTGVTWPTAHQPHNLSTTYSWWTSSPDAVPLTERYQLQGDPRHSPYADTAAGGDSFAHGYNWHFDDLREPLFDASAKWPCLDAARLQDGFGAGAVVDVPRALQVMRTALQACGGILVNPGAPAARSLLIGGEIALPGVAGAGTPSPVTVHGDFLGVGAATGVDTVTPTMVSSTSLGRQVVLGSGASPFWAMEWLGELCPDSAHSGYLTSGNLGTGSLPGTFHREPRSEAVLPHLPAGTDFAFAAGSQLGLAGGVALFDSGTLASTYGHREELTSPVATIRPGAISIALATGDDLPLSMPSPWPFALDEPFPGSLPYFGYTAEYPKSVATLLEPYYADIPGAISAGLISLEAPSTLTSGFLTELALSPTDAAGQGHLAMATLMLGLRSYHRAGEPGVVGRVVQLPLVEIVEPESGTRFTDPSSIMLRWKTSFTRFDGEDYTADYPPGFTEPEADLEYSLLYSRDEGDTWRYALTSDPAILGVRPTDPSLLLSDGSVGPESQIISTPTGSYVGAEYLFRVECYHRTRGSHVSTHEIRAVLSR